MLRRTFIRFTFFLGILSKSSRKDLRFLRNPTTVSFFGTSIINDGSRSNFFRRTYLYGNLSSTTRVAIRFFRFNMVFEDVISNLVTCVIKIIGTGNGGNQLFLLSVLFYRATWNFKVFIMIKHLHVITWNGDICGMFSAIPFVRTTCFHFQPNVA